MYNSPAVGATSVRVCQAQMPVLLQFLRRPAAVCMRQGMVHMHSFDLGARVLEQFMRYIVHFCIF